MTLDLTRPEHREVLAWACKYLLNSGAANASTLLLFGAWTEARPLHAEAFRTLSSPEQSAALVRALLESCGVELRHEMGAVRPWASQLGIGIRVRLLPTFDVDMSAIPALILRLLAAATPEEALATLKAAGR